VAVHLKEDCKARKKVFKLNIAEFDIKGRGTNGNIITKHPLAKVNRGPGSK